MAKSLQLSKQHVNNLVARAQSITARAAKVKEKADMMVETGIRAAVVGGTAFGLGVVQGKYGGIELAGVPLELIVGLGGHIAGFTGVGGKASPMLHNVADGALAAWACTMGRGIGKGIGAKTAVKGDVLTDEEMEKVAKSV